MANGNGNSHEGALPLSLFSRIFNIAPSQGWRVMECWSLTFFFKMGSALGWTVVTAAFVSRYGIAFLPALFVLNALLTMGSTFFFEGLIMRMKRDVLMVLMLLFGATCIFIASFLYDRSPTAFFTLVIFAESFFLAQFNVFIPILIGDRFTPLESQTTFPFIESGETIGGMIGGTLVGVLATKFSIPWFLYAWIGLLSFAIFVFFLRSQLKYQLPPIPFRLHGDRARETTKNQVKLVFRGIQQFPFLKGLVVVVLLQWVFMNILQFQYTKAFEQAVTERYEPTIAAVVDTRSSLASVLGGAEDSAAPAVVPLPPPRELSIDQQQELTKKLGTWSGVFHGAALIVQVLFASRLITGLGVVGAMLIHPVIMLLSLLGMLLRFSLPSVIMTRLSFEVTNVVHKNAYFASHYAFPKFLRDQAAEFLEGMVRPMGTIIGMMFVIGFQTFFAGRNLSLIIHTMMVTIMVAIFIITIRLFRKYTHISEHQLFGSLPYPEKLNAIEILAQRGHKNSSAILVQKLQSASNESPMVRRKLLAALGRFHHEGTLPEILESLYDDDDDVRLEAAHALMNFNNIGEKFYSQAFSRYRVVETLKDVYRRETSSSVRSSIVQVFSILRESDIVVFLLQILKDESPELRAEGIYTLGLFRDPNIAYYVKPFLDAKEPKIIANAIIALWQFPQYRPVLEEKLQMLLTHADQNFVKAGVFAMGDIRLPKKRLLTDFLNAEHSEELRLEAAFALTKLGEHAGFQLLLQQMLTVSNDVFDGLRRFFHRLSPNIKQSIQLLIVHEIAEALNNLGENSSSESTLVLEKLRRLYTLLDEHEELFRLETVLSRASSSPVLVPAVA